MKVYNILSILVLLTVLFTIHVNADYYYQELSPIIIKNPCYNSGAYCSSSALCNITISSPNNMIIVDNKNMSNHVNYFEYTMNTSIKYPIGSYLAQQVCYDGNLSGTETFYIIVKPNKQLFTLDLTTTNGLTIFIILLIIDILILVFVSWNIGALLILITGVLQIVNSQNILIGVILVIISMILALMKSEK